MQTNKQANKQNKNLYVSIALILRLGNLIHGHIYLFLLPTWSIALPLMSSKTFQKLQLIQYVAAPVLQHNFESCTGFLGNSKCWLSALRAPGSGYLEDHLSLIMFAHLMRFKRVVPFRSPIWNSVFQWDPRGMHAVCIVMPSFYNSICHKIWMFPILLPFLKILKS